MIKITIEIARAVAMMAKLEVQSFSLPNGEERNDILKKIEILYNELENQIGPTRLHDIYSSNHYNNIFKYYQDLETYDSYCKEKFFIKKLSDE